MKIVKTAIWVLALAGLAAFGGYRIWQAKQRQDAAAGKGASKKGGGRVVDVALVQSRFGEVRQDLVLAGSLKPKEQVDVVAKVTGRLESLTLQAGDRVKQGDLIAVLDDDELVQQVSRATASLNVARASGAQREAELANAKADFTRFESLLKEGLVPKREYEAQRTATQVVESQLQLARAQLKEAQAELNELKIRQQQTRIHAPLSGWIARRHVDVGALLNPQTPIVTIVNLATMVTLANVPENAIGKLRPGLPAEVQLDAFGDRKFMGRVARVWPVLDPATRSAGAEIEIPNPEGQLKAEMFARVRLDIATTRQAVLIPREALVYRGDQPGVYLARGNKPEFRSVETGITSGNDVEITANLAAGATLVGAGATMLTEGDSIRAGGRGGKKKGAAQ